MPDYDKYFAEMIKRNRKPVARPVKEALDRFVELEAAYEGIRPVDADAINILFYGDAVVDTTRKPLTFTGIAQGREFHNLSIKKTVETKRRLTVWHFRPNRALLGSDFADYGDRILLAELGYFSIDLPKKRAAVDRQRQIDAYLDQAYDVLHLDRKAVHAMIAAKLEAKRFDGIWARSTGEYSEACRKMDMTVLARSPAIAQSIQELTA